MSASSLTSLPAFPLAIAKGAPFPLYCSPSISIQASRELGTSIILLSLAICITSSAVNRLSSDPSSFKKATPL